MACACGGGGTKAPAPKYVWTSPEGLTLTKSSQTEVEYLVSRKGGTWKKQAA